jgi:hypothetical protein
VSNFLAIAAATSTLRQILQDAASEDVSGAEVKMVQPNAPASELPKLGVNLYLYQVTPNAAWRNADVPTRSPNGRLVQRPRVALDLHYLLSFYGDDAKLEPQRLLGSAVSALHHQPILAREKIREVVNAATAADPQHFLGEADLDQEVELVKFTPLPLTLEELGKLWSVFFQTPYALSVAYVGTVVLIERKPAPQPSLPVRDRNVYGIVVRQPFIERVESAAGRDAPITSTSAIRIIGRQLSSDVIQVRVGGVEAAPPADRVTDTEISLPLPAGLAAGVQAVQIVQPVLMGTPPVPHTGVESNAAPFVLRPTITAIVSGVSSSTINGVTVHAATVGVTFAPPVAKGQRVILLLNEFQATPTPDARAYMFDAPAWDDIALPPGVDETADIDFSVSNVIPGEYLVRVQVDGAESLLGQDASGRYATPRVTI